MAANKTSLSAGYVIRELLVNDAEVAAITTKVFPVMVDKATLPYIFYRRASMTGTPTKMGTGSDAINVEVLCCADNYDQSLELAEAVRGALDGVEGQSEETGLRMRSCYLVDSEEGWQDDAYIQQLTFNIKIS